MFSLILFDFYENHFIVMENLVCSIFEDGLNILTQHIIHEFWEYICSHSWLHELFEDLVELWLIFN